MVDPAESSHPPSQPPAELAHGLFEVLRRVVHDHPFATDALLASAILGVSTVWLVQIPVGSGDAALVQTAMVVTLVARRRAPCAVFALMCAIALAQWLLGYQLLGDVALLVGLYTVAVHRSRTRALLATVLLEVGAVMAALEWHPAGSMLRSLLFLSSTVVAALFAGLTVASGSRYLTWLDERARRLEIERDQQATIAAALERTRIARELHDIVSHSLSIVITLADAAALVNRSSAEHGAEAMADVAQVGRLALSDMRAMLGVLRTDDSRGELAPQPTVLELGALVERVRATGLAVHLAMEGTPFPLGAVTELTVYRVVQEALTNTLKHARARHAEVTITYDAPTVLVSVVDDGLPRPRTHGEGHGIEGMRERAALHGGVLTAGPRPDGGWSVSTILRSDGAETPSRVLA